MGPSEYKDQDVMTEMRRSLAGMIMELNEMSFPRPTYGAELVLAVRHLEDARMRLGVARAIADGQDPLAGK